MEINDRGHGKRNSPVGGLQQALGRSRSPWGVPAQSQTQNPSGQSSAAALPIIPESSPDPAQLSHPTLSTSHGPTLQVFGPAANMATLPGLIHIPPQPVLPQQPLTLPQGQLSPQQHLGIPPSPSAGGGLVQHQQQPRMQESEPARYNDPPSVGGGRRDTDVADAAPPGGLVPLRGSLAKAVAATFAGGAAGAGSGSAGQTAAAGGVPVPMARGYGTSYGGSSGGGGAAILAPPPAVTPLSSSLSQGFRQGLPSWLEDHQQQQQQQSLQHYQQLHGRALASPQQASQGEQHTQQLPPKRSPFLPVPQAPRGPYGAVPVSGTAAPAVTAAAAPGQLPSARSLPIGYASGPAVAGPFPSAPRAGLQGPEGPGYSYGHGVGPGPGQAPGLPAYAQDSPEDAAVLGDAPARSTPARGRSGIPRVASISEIEPVVESDEPRRLGSSLLTRAISIPNAHGGDRPRTYRVALPKSQSSQDDVTVVLEGAEGSRGGRGGAYGGSAQGSHHSYGSSGGGGGAGAGAGGGVLGSGGVLSTSLLQGSSLLGSSLLSGLFGSRYVSVGTSAPRGPGFLASPDVSVHGADSLPFAGRDRYHASAELPTSFGSLPTSSLLRSRANASASSILAKATGGLNTKMKRSTSYQQFGSALMGGGAGGAAGGGGAGGTGGGSAAAQPGSDLPSSSSGAGLRTVARRPPRTSVNGGSDSSGACTSTSASLGGGLGLWMRVAGAVAGGSSRGGGAAGAGGAAGGAGSDSEGAVAAGPMPAGRRGAEPDLADLAVLATSLPASLGTWSLPRSVALASSPQTNNTSVRGGNAFFTGGPVGRSLSRADSTNSAAASLGGMPAFGGVGGAAAGAGGSGGPAAGLPICLICLEVLTPEEFESGDAISLQCACKGEVSLRHRKCAIEWSHHKGDVVCDICKQVIANLPPIPPEVLAAREAARRRRQPAFNTAAEPNFADFCFDCIRATWVTMIVCVLFFDVSVGQAFMLGSLVGVAFMVVSMVVAACARRARALAAARAVERAAAESRAQEQQQRQQRRQQQAPAQSSGAGPSGSGGGARGSASGAATGSSLMVPLLSAADV